MLQRELVNDPEVFGSILAGHPAGAGGIHGERTSHSEAGGRGSRTCARSGSSTSASRARRWPTSARTWWTWSSGRCTPTPRSIIAATFGCSRRADGRPPSRRRSSARSPAKPGAALDYYCNTCVSYALRGVHTKLDVLWRWEAPAGTGDTHLAVYRGSKSRVEVRQGKEENYRPELYVIPGEDGVKRALAEKAAALAPPVSGRRHRGPRTGGAGDHTGPVSRGPRSALRPGDQPLLRVPQHPRQFPASENPNMIAKYFVSTKGVEMSHGMAV